MKNHTSSTNNDRSGSDHSNESQRSNTIERTLDKSDEDILELVKAQLPVSIAMHQTEVSVALINLIGAVLGQDTSRGIQVNHTSQPGHCL